MEKEKNEEIKLLKDVMKKSNDELQTNKKEMNQLNKLVKAKEKEKYNLETKVENQTETIKSLKETCNSLKTERRKVEKELKSSRKKFENTKDAVKEAPVKSEVAPPDTDKKDEDIRLSSNSTLDPIDDEQNLSDKIPETMSADYTTSDLNCNSTPIVDIPCVVCGKTFTSATDLREHRQTNHPDMKYTCKLCDQTHDTEEDLFNHRMGESHHRLSKAISDQFAIEVGNVCKECSVIQTPAETFYTFCEKDEHYEKFENIWSNLKGEA